MDELLQFFRDFGNLLNTALILSLTGIVFKIFSATIEQKDATITAIREQGKVISEQKDATITAIREQGKVIIEQKDAAIDAIREQLKTKESLLDWYQESLKASEEVIRKAIEEKEKEFQLRIEEEIEKRDELIREFAQQMESASVPLLRMSHSQVCGIYSVLGHNPQTPELTYYGMLSIEAENGVLLAIWNIGPMNMKHVGTGILVDNVLSVVFIIPDLAQAGIVVYKFITNDVMRGTWTGLGGISIGFEECRRIKGDASHAKTLP